MTDWKGQLVLIEVSDDTGREPASLERHLDTDTMADIFEDFPPSDFRITISPLAAQE